MALHIAAQPKVRGAACHVPCFSQGFHSRQPTLDCWQLHSVVLHCTALRYIRSPAHMLVTFGLNTRFIFLPFRGRLRGGSHITTNFTRCQRKAHSTSFRFIPSSFISAAGSPLAAIAVLACAVVRAAGCHDFCRPVFFSPSGGDQEGVAKNHASPCSVQPLRLTRNTFRAAFLIVRTTFLRQAPCSHPTSCSRTLSVEATSFALDGSHDYEQANALHALVKLYILVSI